ncbi:winged helix-turn-helix transcriptional regulator [Candidatus Woesearchaeota archaeon]|nr:winged helix-turn-helix transcriptional regulator [Candidatus Woesearchaeota archaeon]
MHNKKIGVIIFLFSALLLVAFIIILSSLNQEIAALGCFENTECKKIETSLSIVHLAFGVFGFLFSLGFYLLVFSKGEEAIVQRLEKDTQQKLQEERFSLLLKGLDEFEQQVVKAVREQQGITQNTLSLRVHMSKAKLSQVIALLEKKRLIKREQKGKTFEVYWKEE